jgi:hypothetical protein
MRRVGASIKNSLGGIRMKRTFLVGGAALTAAVAMVMSASTITACGKKKSGGAAAPAANTDITLAGSLSLASTSTSLSLTNNLATDGYDIYCVTFEDTPKADKATVAASGAFGDVMEGFAGKAFGCFLRKDNKTVSDIVFDKSDSLGGDTDSSLLAGAGALKVNIAYDADTGSATAVVDMAQSDSLNADKVAAAKVAVASTDTTVPNMTGTWNMACLGFQKDDGSWSSGCDGMKLGGDMPTSIYLNEYSENGERKVGLWPNATAPLACFGTATPSSEKDPAFKMKIGATERAINLTDLASFQTSIDTVIGDFSTTYPTQYATLINATSGGWESERCKQLDEQAEKTNENFNDTNCKLVTPPMRSVQKYNPATGQIETWDEPSWYSNWTAVTEATEVVDSYVGSHQETCYNPKVSTEPVAGMNPCPFHVVETDATSATKTYDVFDYVDGATRKPLMFLCKNPMDTSNFMWFPVVPKGSGDVSYKAASIAKAKSMAGGGAQNDKMCTKSAFNGQQLYASQQNEVRRAFMEMVRNNKGNESYNPCSEWTMPAAPADFLFGNCQAMNGDGDTEGRGVCWSYTWALQNIGMQMTIDATTKKATGFATATQPQQWMDKVQANFFCPDAAATLVMPGPSVSLPTGDWNGSADGNGTWEDYFATKKTACQTEFAVGGLTAQITKVFDAAFKGKNVPPSIVLQCGAGNATMKAAMVTMAQNACMPEAEIRTRCDNGQCAEELRCWGTDDGKCLDATTGKFKGRIPGRFELTTLKPRVNGAFEMFGFTSESWEQWDEGKAKNCKNISSFMMNNIFTGANAFDAVMNNKNNQYCSGDTTKAADKAEPPLKLHLTKQ